MGPARWRVEFVRGLEATDGSGPVDGEFLQKRNTIRIRWGLSPGSKAGALLHEVIHAALYTSGLSQTLSHVSEERIAAALEPMLLDALRRNRWFVLALLARGGRKDKLPR